MDNPRRLVVEASRRHGFGGVAVGIVGAASGPVIECAGLADHAGRRAVDASTVFRIASISKTLTAIGVMQLRDAGLLDLDQLANESLRRIRIEPPPGAPAVTLRHLLTHTSGIGEAPKVSDLFRREAWGAGPRKAGPSDLARLYGGVLHTGAAAGSKWAYANHGFAVLGQVVEDVSGYPFADYMREHVLRPLGMVRADYTRTDAVAGSLATGYHWMFGRFGAIKDYDLTLFGAGSVLAPLTDMLEYASWLARAGRDAPAEVIAPETLDEMLTPAFSIDPRLPGMGLAFMLDRFGSHRVIGHDGNNPGFASSLLAAPDDGIAVVVLTNTSTFSGAHLLAAALMRSVLGVSDPGADLASAGVWSSPHLWPDLVGDYAPAPGFLTNLRTWEMTGGEVQVFVRDRRLHIRALSPFPQLRRGLELHPVDESDPLLFAINVDGLVIRVAFRADDSGNVTTVCVGAPATAVFHRRGRWRSSRRRLTAAAAAGAGLATAAAAIRRRDGS